MTQDTGFSGRKFADALNRDCHCIAVDKESLHAVLESHLQDSGLPEQLLDTHSRLFADTPVFLWQGHIDSMARLIRAVRVITDSAAYRDLALSIAPASAQLNFGPRGVFFGYDFHLGEDGPQLIEINTNAGGVLLNSYLSSAQQACCPEVISFFGGKSELKDAEHELVAMFQKEWCLQRPDGPLRSIAIVDEDPTSQFLYPEFLLFQSLFERHGIKVIIAGPADFSVREGALRIAEQEIDLVYNRLTDFYLQGPESSCLLEAYQDELAVFTPSPNLYALYADKRNLTVLSDPDKLRELGIGEETIATLAQMVPTTEFVTEENAERLWAHRKQLFFKPATGFGSRGAYRGAKVTRRVWSEIVGSDYVAQAVVPPSERKLVINGEERLLKLDIRCVTYDDRIQQLSARLYRGQTTNLRTEGGGLATVFSTPNL